VSESQPPQPATRPHLRLVQALTIVVVIASLAAAVYFRDHLQELAGYGYAAVFLVGLVSNATLIFPIPGLAVSSLLGGLFNPWLVGLLGGVGQALGELSGYMVGYSGQTLVDRTATYERVGHWMNRHGMLTIFVMAILPNPLFDVGGMVAGAIRFPVGKFLLSCAVGKVIKNIAFALAGSYGIEALWYLLER